MAISKEYSTPVLLVFLHLTSSDLPYNRNWGSWEGSWQICCIPQRSRIGTAMERGSVSREAERMES